MSSNDPVCAGGPRFPAVPSAAATRVGCGGRIGCGGSKCPRGSNWHPACTRDLMGSGTLQLRSWAPATPHPPETPPRRSHGPLLNIWRATAVHGLSARAEAATAAHVYAGPYKQYLWRAWAHRQAKAACTNKSTIASTTRLPSPPQCAMMWPVRERLCARWHWCGWGPP